MTSNTKTASSPANASTTRRSGKPARNKTASYLAVAFVALYLMYLVASAWYLPHYLKQGIPQWLAQVIVESAYSTDNKRPLQGSANRIGFNPFTLTLRIEDLNISEASSADALNSSNIPQTIHPSDLIFSADAIAINLELSSLLKRALVLSQFHIQGPQVHITKHTDHRFIWDRIVKDSADKPLDNNKETALFPVVVDELAITKASLTYTDLALATPYQKTLSPINLELFNLSTLPDHQGIYELNVKLPQKLQDTVQPNAVQYPEAEFVWRGELALNPLQSKGRLQLNQLAVYTVWEYIQDQVLHKPLAGDLQITLDYDFSLTESLAFKIHNGHVQVNNLHIEPKATTGLETPAINGMTAPLFSFKQQAVEGIHFDLANQTVSIDAIRYQSIDGSFNRLADGTLQLIKILSERPVRAAIKETVEDATDSTQWNINVGQFEVLDSKMLIQDFTTPTPMIQRVEDINITMTDFSNYQPDQQSQLSLGMSLPSNQATTGQIKVQGQLSPMAQAANLTIDLSALHLPAFAPYLDKISALDLASADLGVNGQLSVKEQKLLFNGSSQITDIELNNQNYLGRSSEQAPIANILSGEGIYIDGIMLDQANNQLAINSILLDRMVYPFSLFNETDVKDPQADHQNHDDNMSVANNFKDLFYTQEASKATAEAPLNDEAAPMLITIDQIRFENNQMLFTDRTPTTPVLVEIEQLNGNISGLSSENTQKAAIALAGEVNGYAPLKITGQLNPLSEDLYTDISITLDELSLTTFSPYAAQFLGYGIEQGKFNTALNYRVNQQSLKADNHFIIQQMELGDTSDNDKAIRLPMPLILTLLKDKEGNIDIDLPVSGNLNDPNFKYGHIVLNSFTNLLKKAAASPFNALASLTHIQQDPDQILFEHNQSQLSESQQQYLNQLASALSEKPDLKLAITGQGGQSEFAITAPTATQTPPPAQNPNDLSVAATRLAKARAKAVYDHMKAQGVPSQQLYLRTEQTEPDLKTNDAGLITGVKLALF